MEPTKENVTTHLPNQVRFITQLWHLLEEEAQGRGHLHASRRGRRASQTLRTPTGRRAQPPRLPGPSPTGAGTHAPRHHSMTRAMSHRQRKGSRASVFTCARCARTYSMGQPHPWGRLGDGERAPTGPPRRACLAPSQPEAHSPSTLVTQDNFCLITRPWCWRRIFQVIKCD